MQNAPSLVASVRECNDRRRTQTRHAATGANQALKRGNSALDARTARKDDATAYVRTRSCGTSLISARQTIELTEPSASV